MDNKRCIMLENIASPPERSRLPVSFAVQFVPYETLTNESDQA